MDLKAKLASQIGDDVQHIFDHEALFKLALARIRALEALVERAATSIECGCMFPEEEADEIRQEVQRLDV